MNPKITRLNRMLHLEEYHKENIAKNISLTDQVQQLQVYAMGRFRISPQTAKIYALAIITRYRATINLGSGDTK